MTTAERVKSIIVSQLGVDLEALVPEADLRDDLGLDPIDIPEFIMAFDEAFGIEITDYAMGQITTVRSLTQYVEAQAGA